MNDPARPARHGGRNVVLTGFMGTGKTTVGRRLADRLGYRFVDTDELIVARHGPIPQIFADHGEDTFRRHERVVAAELSARDGLVVSTGGRLMLDGVNAELLGDTGTVVCLVASVGTIVQRVTADGSWSTRPLLAGDDAIDRIVALLDERRAGYGRFTPVETDDRSPDQVVDAIVEVLGTHA